MSFFLPRFFCSDDDDDESDENDVKPQKTVGKEPKKVSMVCFLLLLYIMIEM